FAARVRETQTDNSLKILLTSPHSTFKIVTGLATYPIFIALCHTLTLLAAGILLFDAKLSINPISFIASLALSLCAFKTLGLLSAAFVLAFKQNDPFTYTLDITTYLLTKIVYPIKMLPE